MRPCLSLCRSALGNSSVEHLNTVRNTTKLRQCSSDECVPVLDSEEPIKKFCIPGTTSPTQAFDVVNHIRAFPDSRRILYGIALAVPGNSIFATVRFSVVQSG